MPKLSIDGIKLKNPIHDCRLETLRLKSRDPTVDATILSRGLSNTRNSAVLMQEKYLVNMLQNRQNLCLEIQKNFPNT